MTTGGGETGSNGGGSGDIGSATGLVFHAVGEDFFFFVETSLLAVSVGMAALFVAEFTSLPPFCDVLSLDVSFAEEFDIAFCFLPLTGTFSPAVFGGCFAPEGDTFEVVSELSTTGDVSG